MKKLHVSLLITLLFAAICLVSVAAAAAPSGLPGHQMLVDDQLDPLTASQRASLQQGLQARLHGKAQGHTYRAQNGRFVELERIGEDQIGRAHV